MARNVAEHVGQALRARRRHEPRSDEPPEVGPGVGHGRLDSGETSRSSWASTSAAATTTSPASRRARAVVALSSDRRRRRGP